MRPLSARFCKPTAECKSSLYRSCRKNDGSTCSSSHLAVNTVVHHKGNSEDILLVGRFYRGISGYYSAYRELCFCSFKNPFPDFISFFGHSRVIVVANSKATVDININSLKSIPVFG